jgi:mevalonate kinase
MILFGEHAVVYGQPAIAVPIKQIQARSVIQPDIHGARDQVTVIAPDIDLEGPLKDMPLDHALHQAITLTLNELGLENHPAFTLKITSSIPLAAGLGSGAAVTVSIIRAVSAFLGHPLNDEKVNMLTYEIEKIHHGTPSGIDNTVITYARPVYFVRKHPIETLNVGQPFTIVIGDTGIPSPTSVAVGDVREGWQSDPDRFEQLFEYCGRIAIQARDKIEEGSIEDLGPMMDQNHGLLQDMGVSSPALDKLVSAARKAGALGAKLSGGGRGGNMIALVEAENAEELAVALRKVGAVGTIINTVESTQI